MTLHAALNLVFPPQCISCAARVDDPFGLCGECWSKTPFIMGLACDLCGAPLPGEEEEAVICDDCRQVERPWVKGRAALLYKGNARKLLLALKQGDRLELARPAGDWIARVAEPLVQARTLVAPIPSHWRRMLLRRHNPAALLAGRAAETLRLAYCPDLLVKTRHTDVQDGRSPDDRFKNVERVFAVHPRRRHRLIGRDVLLVDDVMTSGATFTAAVETCLIAGAASVSVVALARVTRND